MQIDLIKVSGGRNIRQLSQYTALNGKKIKENKLFRSARLDKMSTKKRNNFLRKYNIKTVIDLRTDIEVEEGKKIILPGDVKYYHISLLEKEFFGITHEKKMSKIMHKESKNIKSNDQINNYMTEMYKSIVFSKNSQAKFKEFFDILLNKTDGAILYHCTGGKDRTGISSLFILTILGVDRNTIIEDYAVSDIANKRHNFILSTLIKLFLFNKNFKRLLLAMLYCKKEYLEKTIEAIEEKYESVINYLEVEIGIDEEKQNRLKELYLN